MILSLAAPFHRAWRNRRCICYVAFVRRGCLFDFPPTGGMKPETLILVGTAFSFFFSASTSFWRFLQTSISCRGSALVLWHGQWRHLGAKPRHLPFCRQLFRAAFAVSQAEYYDDGRRFPSLSMGVNTSALRTVVLLLSVPHDLCHHLVYWRHRFYGPDCASYRLFHHWGR